MLVDKFDIYEKSDLRRRYKGKVFLFEKCIVYTEISGKNKLYYRGCFRQATLGFTFEDQRNCFRLYNERKGNQEIEFISEPQTFQQWIQILNRTMASVVMNGSYSFEVFTIFINYNVKVERLNFETMICLFLQCLFFTEKKKIEENRKGSVRSGDFSAIQVLLRINSPRLQDFIETPNQSETRDSAFFSTISNASGESCKTENHNMDSISIKSNRK